MRYNIIHIYVTAAVMLLCCACKDDIMSSGVGEGASGSIIHVGADMDDAVVLSAITRAGEQPKDAETVDWLVQPLMKGLDITYGNILSDGRHANKSVAILKLLPNPSGPGSTPPYATDPNSGFAVYSFNYRSNEGGGETTTPAIWYDNGKHFFEGVHVPYRLRYITNPSELEQNNRKVYEEEGLAAVHDLTTDQHDDKATGSDNDLGNYTLLAHYLGMPANTQLSATVARIKLPFRHRLCRVLAYILIDPALKTGANPAKIKGYKETEAEKTADKDDPTTSSIRFCNVDVLEGVHDVYDQTHKLHTLTPKWAEKVRKVVPHFVEEKETFKTYQSKDKIYFEGSSDFPSTKPAGYDEVDYVKVPVYDLIVRPTYTSASNVMYDEDLSSMTGSTEDQKKQQYAAKTNQIDFTVSLDNGLTYEKHVTIDLDANYQTIIYLRISHEGVDYNKSGSEKWVEKPYNDKWYGVDNQNGNTLSQAGSSWQRAYYNRSLSAEGGDNITDGGFYDENTVGEDGTKGQYVRPDTWREYLLQAFKGGKNHGDYFVLGQDITIDASLLPSDGIIFTGHLDGFNTHGERAYHTITLENAGKVMACTETVTDVLAKLYDDSSAEHPVPQLYWMKEIAQTPSRRTDGIDKGEPIAFVMSNTYPKDLEGLAIYTKVGDEYRVYANRMFYKKTAGFLFAGLDGIYGTKQEEEEAAGRPIYNQSWSWEANVHKEGNYWLPYRDVTGANPTNTGWRAEVLNLTVEGGSLFKEGAVITGNVENCKYVIGEKSYQVNDHRPAMPKYK